MKEEKLLDLIEQHFSTHVFREMTWNYGQKVDPLMLQFVKKISDIAIAEHIIEHHAKEIKELQNEMFETEEYLL